MPDLTRTDSDLIQQLDDIAIDLEEMNCAVAFWHVPRRYNRDADMLANQALY